tara:strand:+ start:419 stop:580 length:162 start_codon:yes stop_codon:yes gene_type:complete
MNNPFDRIDPIQIMKKKKKDNFIDQFIQMIKNKDKKSLLEINELIIKRLNELK